MSITPEQERWGVAVEVIRQHGEDAQVHIIERTRHSAAKGDEEGARFWIDIGRRIHDLTKTDESEVH